MKIKKYVSLLIILAMAVALCGCGKDPEPQPGPEDDPSGGKAGGWTLPDSMAYQELPEEVKKAYDKALEGFAGTEYQPLALLGQQVVAGMNYAILCKATPAVLNPVPKLQVITIYADLDGGAQILDIDDFDLGDYATDAEPPVQEILDGGWGVNTELERIVLPDDVEKAFSKAFEGFTGTTYVPVLHLGEQMVAGTNYALLCLAAPTTLDPIPYLSVVTVYADLNGGAEPYTFHGVELGGHYSSHVE